ncbi:hypothetical protein Btru_045232 [Bulinus truncatus]|nr:hypothetical protein Btru_045232 [Bulinus truncatus]
MASTNREKPYRADPLPVLIGRLNPVYDQAMNNLGNIYKDQNRLAEAEELLRQSYGYIYMEMKRHQDALDAWKNATQLKPTHWNSWNNAIILLDNLKYYDQAANVALTALQFLPNHPALLFSLANVFGKQENYNESEKYFLLALQGDPNNSNIHMNLGVLYHRWGKYKKAQLCYQKSLELDPHNKAAVDNWNLLKTKMKMSG